MDQVSPGNEHILGIDVNGKFLGLGFNLKGQIENSVYEDYYATPVQLGSPGIENSIGQQVLNGPQNLSVNISAGQLSSAINDNDKLSVTSLTVSGTIDARDFAFMRDSMVALSIVDIKACTIDGYIGTEGTGDGNYLYLANEIPFNAFYNASTRISKITLEEIYIPPSVTSIETMSFYYCSGLKKVLFSASSVLTNVGGYTFAGCSSLSDVVLPETVTTLAGGAFYYTNHYVFNVPASVTFIGNQALALVKNQINVDAANPNYKSMDGVLYSKDEKKLLQCPSEKEGAFVMPSTVESVEMGAFFGCRFLTSITNSWSLRKIEDYAFYICSYLTGYEIPEGVTAIKPYTFAGCNGLLSIYIPRSVSSIGNSAFLGCAGLTSVGISNITASIESNAFAHCTGLTSFYANPASPVNLTSSTNVFQNVNKSACVLYVPADSKVLYQEAEQWKDFLFIEEMEPTNVTDFVENNFVLSIQNKEIILNGVVPGEQVSVFNLQGQTIYKKNTGSSNIAISIPMSGVYIVQVGVKRVKVFVD